jgi:uncharacterized protein (UPF0332 family)
MGEDERLSAVTDELRLLLDELRSFHANRQVGVHRKCISSLHYAAFHAVRALLFSHGLETKTHEGTQRLFAAHFVRPGAFDREHLKTLGQLEADRLRADYQGFHQFDAEDVARAYVSVVALVLAAMDDLEVRIPASIQSIAPSIRAEIARDS